MFHWLYIYRDTVERRSQNTLSLLRSKAITFSPSTAEIVERVRTGGARPFRPLVKDQSYPGLKYLMDMCLEEDPSNRPDCSSIKNTIKKMNK